METITFLLAIVGAVTGVVALGWNIVSFLLSGHRIDVDLTNGVTLSLANDRQPRATWNLTVKVSNRGRQGASVLGLEFVSGQDPNDGLSWMDWVGPTFPHRLDGQTEATWRCESPQLVSDALRSSGTGQRPVSCRVVALLPGGKTKLSKPAVVEAEESLRGLDIRQIRFPSYSKPDAAEPPRPPEKSEDDNPGRT